MHQVTQNSIIPISCNLHTHLLHKYTRKHHAMHASIRCCSPLILHKYIHTHGTAPNVELLRVRRCQTVQKHVCCGVFRKFANFQINPTHISKAAACDCSVHTIVGTRRSPRVFAFNHIAARGSEPAKTMCSTAIILISQ